MTEIVHLEKLTFSAAVAQAAAKGNADVMARCDLSWPPATARNHAVAAMEGAACVGLIAYEVDEDDKAANVNLAWVEEGRDSLLARLLARLRTECLAAGAREITFTRQLANDRMAKAARVFGKPYSETYRIQLKGSV